jgi:parallel beta-helix repeat protein
MKKIAVLMIALGLLLTSSLASVNAFEGDMLNEYLSLGLPETHHSYYDIYVDDDNTEGPWDGTPENPYRYIRDGIDNATEGDVIYVFSGLYDEVVKYLNIMKSVKLIGEDRDSTIITKSVGIYTDNVTVNGFTMKCINVHEGSNCTISGNKLTNRKEAYHVISVGSSSNVIGNLLTNLSNNDRITIIETGSHCNIIGNTVTKVSGDSYVNAIEADAHCNISGNIVTNLNGQNYIFAITAENYCHIIGNTVTDMDGNDYVKAIEADSHCNITGNIVTNMSSEGFLDAIVANSHCNITGNTITNLMGLRATGIYIDSSHSNIAENTITNLYGDMSKGISVNIDEFSSNTIVENDISNIIGYYADGINIFGKMDNPSKEYATTVIRNSVSNCGYSCIYLAYTHYITIKENTLIGQYPNRDSFGICFGGFVTQTTVSNNTIMSNSRGIYLSIGCKKNTVSKNTITNNGEGIGMGRGPNDIGYASNNKIIGNNITDTTRYGIYCEKGSRSNHIYYNNFINNGNSGGAGNAYDIGSGNTWYKYKLFGKSMGNYWDDYTGQDNDGDGIGDTPYKIPGKKIPRKDRYPVMEPFDIENIEVTLEEYKTQELLSNKNIQSFPLSSPTNN